MNDEGAAWRRTVMAGFAALAAAALIVGVVVGIVAVGAARVTGLGGSNSGAQAPERLVLPPYEKTPEQPASERPQPNPSRVSAVPLDPSSGPTSQVGRITLFATPSSVGVGARINLNGVYLDGEGVSLQVQRRDGDAWVDFPTTATVRSGGFDTYIYTGRSGVNMFRVFDPTTGRSSNAVSVTVG